MEMLKRFRKGEKLKICVVGGGNVGSLLLGDLGSNEQVSVSLLTSRPQTWRSTIEVCSPSGNVKYSGKIDYISDKPEEVVEGADIIFSTVPSNVFPSVIQQIRPHIKHKAWLGVMPGTGGAEFYSAGLGMDCVLFGFQRVHGIARIKKYGRSVYDLGKKNQLYIASIPPEHTITVCLLVEQLLGIECNPLPNYLNVTLTPSNPILHTARLYSMFRDYRHGVYWEKPINFYEEWSDESSEILMACDAELQFMCRRIKGLDLTGVRSLREHYESDTSAAMTRKIKSIQAFKGINAPMVENPEGFIPDFQSRYFTEDFPYGLCIIKGIADILRMETPRIDEVLQWYETVTGVTYYENGYFNGPDLEGLPIPRNFGIDSMEELVRYYS